MREADRKVVAEAELEATHTTELGPDTCFPKDKEAELMAGVKGRPIDASATGAGMATEATAAQQEDVPGQQA